MSSDTTSNTLESVPRSFNACDQSAQYTMNFDDTRCIHLVFFEHPWTKNHEFWRPFAYATQGLISVLANCFFCTYLMHGQKAFKMHDVLYEDIEYM